MQDDYSESLFAQYIKCPYKAYLSSSGKESDAEALEFFFENRDKQYHNSDDALAVEAKIRATDSQSPIEFTASNKIAEHSKLKLGRQVLERGSSGKKRPKHGVIFFGSAYSKTKITLKKYITASLKIIADIEKIQNENHVPHFTLNEHCRICRYHDHCWQKAVQSDDLSLISGISKKEQLKLNKRGIFTVTQLGHSFSPQRRRMKAVVKHQSALKALAIKDKKIYVNKPPTIPNKPIKLFLDVEGIPDENFYYLIGLKVVNGATEKNYSWLANIKDDARTIWHEFLEKVLAYKDFSLFHYGSYELDFLRGMFKAYQGCTEEEFKTIIASSVNVLTFCHLNIYFPTFTNGLKEIGIFLNFNWQAPDASGLMSVVWRYSWQDSRDSSIKAKLIQYNADDCAALN